MSNTFNTKPEADLSSATQMVFFLALGKYLLGPFEPGPCDPTETKNGNRSKSKMSA
jgi:hypothetical protein